MAISRSSSARMARSWATTPSVPPTASAYAYGRPIPTAVAPSARALATSEPLRTAAIEQHRHSVGGLDHSRQCFECGQPSVGLAAAVVGAVDAVDAVVAGAAHVVGMLNALEQHRQAGQ